MTTIAQQMKRQEHLGQLYAALTVAIHSGDAIEFFQQMAPREHLIGIREEAFRQYQATFNDTDDGGR